MSWLAEYVRPKIRTLLGRREVPDNLWVQCPECQQMLFASDLARNLKVCTACGFHMRPTAAERLAYTFDADPGFTRIELPRAPLDPLRFRDSKRYADRLKEAREKTGLDDAILVAHGAIGGHRAVVAAQAFEFMGGSMGAAVGEAIVAAARLAVLQQAPLIVFTASASSTEMRWFAPHVVPSQPVRVTMPWTPMSGANGPGLKSDPAAARTPASSRVRYAMLRVMSASP